MNQLIQHPEVLQKAIDEAISATRRDIRMREDQGESAEDLVCMLVELHEMKKGLRFSASRSMSYVIIDSMDWNQPCLKHFQRVQELLRQHYRSRQD